jgi:hypothetical protein
MTERTSLNQEEKVIYAFTKSPKEEVRISETLYLDRHFIDIRIFCRDKEGNWLPTKRGITLSKDIVRNLLDGFKKIQL